MNEQIVVVFDPVPDFIEVTNIDSPCRRFVHKRLYPGAQFYLSPYWTEIVSFSPQSRIVRYRRVHEQTIRRMGRIAFERKARAA